MIIGPVLNKSLYWCIEKNPGISYEEMWDKNKGKSKAIFDHDLNELILAGEVKEEDGCYWIVKRN